MFVAVMPAGDDGGGNLALHTLIGGIILVFMLIRFAVRWAVKQPEWASTGNSFLDLVGNLTHFTLYFFLPKERRKAPCFSNGDIRRNLDRAIPVFEWRSGQLFYGSFPQFELVCHIPVIALHIGAAFYHQFLVRII